MSVYIAISNFTSLDSFAWPSKRAQKRPFCATKQLDTGNDFVISRARVLLVQIALVVLENNVEADNTVSDTRHITFLRIWKCQEVLMPCGCQILNPKQATCSQLSTKPQFSVTLVSHKLLIREKQAQALEVFPHLECAGLADTSFLSPLHLKSSNQRVFFRKLYEILIWKLALQKKQLLDCLSKMKFLFLCKRLNSSDQSDSPSFFCRCSQTHRNLEYLPLYFLWSQMLQSPTISS